MMNIDSIAQTQYCSKLSGVTYVRVGCSFYRYWYRHDIIEILLKVALNTINPSDIGRIVDHH
jgi:hypothetical protein